nr:serine/threonine protein kinase [Actinocorallia populi]
MENGTQVRERLHADDPRKVGPYELYGRLGDGRMGILFQGRSAEGREVALRLVHRVFAADPFFRQKLAREAAVLRRVAGPQLAPLVDARLDGDPLWFASDHLRGPSLTEALGRHGPWPQETVRSLGVSLAQGLVTLHDSGLAHRDLTPKNVILTEDGPHLVDFGLAGLFDAGSRSAFGVPMGTLPFLPPELLRGENEPGPAGDIFALGALLVHAAGGSPFGADTSAAVLHRVLHEKPALSPLADPALREAVAACLAKDPGHRPTLRELHTVLASAGRLTQRRLPEKVAELVLAHRPKTPPPRTVQLSAAELERLAAFRHRYEQVIAAGHPEEASKAMVELGALEAGAGNIGVAVSWLERAVATGHPLHAALAQEQLLRLPGGRHRRRLAPRVQAPPRPLVGDAEVVAVVVLGGEGAQGGRRVDRDGVGKRLEEGDVRAGVPVGDAVVAGQGQGGQDAVDGGDLVGRGEDAGGVRGLAQRQGREAGGDDLAQAVRQEAAGEEVRRHRDDDGVLAAPRDVGEDLRHAADPRGRRERLGHDGLLQVVPQAAQAGGEPPRVEEPAGEVLLQQFEVGQAAEAAGDLQSRRGVTQKGAVQVEHVQATHARHPASFEPRKDNGFPLDGTGEVREGAAFLVSGGTTFLGKALYL